MQLIRRLKIDLIHSHLLFSNLYCAMISALARKPLIATFHGMVDVSSEERLLGLKFALMNAVTHDFVAVSERLLDLFEQQYRLSRKKTTVIYNGVDIVSYDLPKSNRLRRQLKIPDNSFLFGCLGNVRPAKAYDLMTRTVAECRKKGLDLYVLVAGDPRASLMAWLTELADTLNVSSRIHYIGFIDDTAEYLSNLDGFLLTSSSEGFSISTIEAMSAGLPVIATRCGGPEEIIKHEETGWLVENGSETALACAIDTIINQPDKALDVAKHAQVDARKRFDIKIMVNKYVELYQNALL